MRARVKRIDTFERTVKMRHHSLFVLLLVVWANALDAASFAELPSKWKEVSLLNNRIAAQVPEVARLTPPTHGIMEAPAPPERELRVIVDAGPARLVAVVSELFRVAPRDFLGLGTAYVKTMERRFRFDQLMVAATSTNVNGLELLEYEPRGKATVPGAHMVKGVLLRQADGSLQSIGFFVNDAGLADLPAARQLVTRVITSLKPGARKLLSGARVRLADTGLSLDLPPGYTSYAQRGRDFHVHWVEHLVALDKPAGRLGIYSGHHPQRPAAPATARSIPATLFGVQAEWKAWESNEGTSAVPFRQEAFITSPVAGGGMLHIFLHAASDAERGAFQRIAESASFQ